MTRSCPVPSAKMKPSKERGDAHMVHTSPADIGISRTKMIDLLSYLSHFFFQLLLCIRIMKLHCQPYLHIDCNLLLFQSSKDDSSVIRRSHNHSLPVIVLLMITLL